MLTENKSLDFFKWLLETDRSEDLYIYIVNKYNREKPADSEITGDQAFEPLFNFEIQKHSKLLEKELTSIYMSQDLAFEELFLTLDKLTTLSKILYPNFPFLHDELQKLKNLVLAIDPTSKKSFLSFTWQIDMKFLLTLYDKLTEAPEMIMCKKSDFIKAFTGEKINGGIHWLPKAKNGQTSKALLFYFIEQVESNGFIKEVDDYSKPIESVFLDADGKELKHLKQSKSSKTKYPTGYERIDEIINHIQFLQRVK